MLEHSLYQEDVIIPNTYAPNEITSRYVKTIYIEKEEIVKSTVRVEDSNTLSSGIPFSYQNK